MAANLKIFYTDKLDSCLNTFREVYSDPLKSGDDNSFNSGVILPLDFSLEMDGLSGIIPHSAFTIPSDSLPSSYLIQSGSDKGKQKIAFILHTIEQNFGENKWTTKITGQTLNIRFEPLTEEEKAAIKAAKSKQKSLSDYKDTGPKLPLNTPDPPIKVTKEVNTFAEVVKAVVINLEGGYYNGGGNKDKRYATSGETMFGIDRVRGGTLNTSAAGKKFWKIMDDNNAKTKWPWLYVPKDPIKSELLKLVAEIMKPEYDRLAKIYLKNTTVRTLIESDGRLYYNMVYASWNGSGWFGGFAKLLTNAYNAGSKTSDQLLTVITKERISGGYTAYNLGTGKKLGKDSASLISQTGYKIAKATGVNV
jgi:hypothetical protein